VLSNRRLLFLPHGFLLFVTCPSIGLPTHVEHISKYLFLLHVQTTSVQASGSLRQYRGSSFPFLPILIPLMPSTSHTPPMLIPSRTFNYPFLKQRLLRMTKPSVSNHPRSSPPGGYHKTRTMSLTPILTLAPRTGRLISYISIAPVHLYLLLFS
jgi:hypothetical protein